MSLPPVMNRTVLVTLLSLLLAAVLLEPLRAQRLDGLHAGSVANAAEELLVVREELRQAGPGDLIFAVGEGFGNDPSEVTVLVGDQKVMPLGEPLFQPGIVAFVIPVLPSAAIEDEVEVRVTVGERTTEAQTLLVRAPAALEAPPGYTRRTLQATLALTYLLEGEARLAAEEGIPVDLEHYAEALAGHRSSLLDALSELKKMEAEEIRRLDQELYDAKALERIRTVARDLARRGPECDDIERYAGHASNVLSGLGSIVGGCVPVVGGCIGGILSALGNGASSLQAEAARECARQKEKKEKERWEELFRRLDGLEEGQQRLENKVDVLTSRVNRLETKVDKIEAKLDEIQNKLRQLEDKAERHTEMLAKLEAKADKIERKLDRQEKKLDTLEIKLDRLEIKADKIEKKLDKIEQKLDRQEKKLDRLEKKLDRQERKLDKGERKLDRLERKLDRPAIVDWDFGDAPDGEEPTGYPEPFAQRGRFPSHRNTPHGASGHGIRHQVIDGKGDRLGDTRDGEPDALTIDGDLDDLPDRPGPLATSPRGNFQVTVHANPAVPTPRYLNLLYDRNRDGDWSDPGEWSVSNREVNRDASGQFIAVETVELEVDPNGALGSGLYWVRISLTPEPIPDKTWDGSGPAAGYRDGETEDFLMEVQ